MIKFLRKIRKQLLSQNRFTKYLIYAVGEIVLVVIGILIALQINNWNESKKLKKEEIKLLVRLDKALIIEFNDLKDNDSRSKKTLNSYGIINNHLSTDLRYHDSLAIHFGHCFNATNFISDPSKLNSYNLDLISNEELKTKIIKYYGFDIPHLINVEQQGLNEHYNTIVLPILIEKFNYSWLDRPATPINYGDLRNDSYFLNLLNTTQSIFEYKHYLTTIVLESAKNLRVEIKNELANSKI